MLLDWERKWKSRTNKLKTDSWGLDRSFLHKYVKKKWVENGKERLRLGFSIKKENILNKYLRKIYYFFKKKIIIL